MHATGVLQTCSYTFKQFISKARKRKKNFPISTKRVFRKYKKSKSYLILQKISFLKDSVQDLHILYAYLYSSLKLRLLLFEEKS